MRLGPATLLIAIVIAAIPARAGAQQPAPGSDTTIAERHDVINDKEHHYIGKVEFESGDAKLYADDVWYYVDENRAIATGNVVFRQGTNQISADRADFDTKTRLGTFYNASGFATAQPQRQTVRPGGFAPPPPIAGQETVVYFFGETVEKIGPRKYKIAKGGFTTCVQPTPRWDFHADTIVLNLDHYTLLRQVVMNVKGVPLFYLPAMYYPTKKENRATGFLLPTYGTTTLRGQSIHNAFFWAIDRSQDATIMYDWFSKAGQGVGTEYRYNFGGGSDGTLRTYMLDETLPNADGSPGEPSRSYEVHGSASQLLPGKLRARATVDYFSSFATNQSFSTDINTTSLNQRNFGGNLVGAWGTYTLNGTFNHAEYFANQTSSTLTGSWPRLSFARNERPIPGTPFYISVGSEYVHILQDSKDDTAGTDDNRSLTRLDFTPQIRFPFKKWQWFTVNSTAGWRDTYYSRSCDPSTIDPTCIAQPTPIDVGLNRRYFTVQSQITGPVFNRIWDTPDNGYAEKFKHSVEPYLNVQFTSPIHNYDQILKLEGTDFAVGGDGEYTYGFTNRFYAKRRLVPGQPAQAREIFTIDVRQTYYTKPQASPYDSQYSTSNTGAPPSNFSPIALSVRSQPTNAVNATVSAEYDAHYHGFRTMSANGTYSWSANVQATLGWSKTFYIPELSPGGDNSSQSLNGTSNVHTKDNKYGAIYSFNYDVLNGTILQERMSGFYNTQCCGLSFEYQTFNFPATAGLSIPSDHRFFMSFTLAGLGNFSPFNGALGGAPR